MERTSAHLKLATKATEALKSVNIADGNVTSITFGQYDTSVQLKACPEAYSFVNVMQAKLKLRIQDQHVHSSDTYDFVMTRYKTSTQLDLTITIGTPIKK